MNTRIMLAINGGSALVLAWLYGGDVSDALRARTAEVSALLEPPNLTFALVALAATAVGFGATVLGLVQKQAPGWRGYRLMPIVAVVVLFVDLFILSGNKSPLGTVDRTALTLRSFDEAASAAATPSSVPRDARDLQAMLDQFGPPAYLVKGQPAKAWTLALREGCTGPVTDAKGAAVGTVFYCLAADGKTAWISLVTLPAGTYFGTPAMFSHGDEPVTAVVTASIPDDPAGQGESPVQEENTDPEVPDSGR